MKVLLSGGGTGGHVYPAIAIANKIKEEEKCKIKKRKFIAFFYFFCYTKAIKN